VTTTEPALGTRTSWVISCDLERGFDDVPPDAESATRDRCTVLFQGQLYDRPELQRELELPPGSSSAEIVLAAYVRWGREAVNRFNGVYAWALWDDRQRLLLCARDPLGFLPLFYAQRKGTILLSSTPEALLGHPLVPTSLNRAALADHVCHRWPDPGETYYDAIRRVPPGHVLMARDETLRVERYWNPAPPDKGITWITEDELDRFDELMDQAVGRALDLGRIGIFLSGGLDSVSVAAVAADRARREALPDPLALSLAFPDVEANEEEVQKGVAGELGLPQVLLRLEEAVGPKGILDAALKLSSTWTAPLMNVWYPAYYSLTLAGADRGCRVIVTGSGGDEWLGVSPFLAADLMRSGNARGVYRLWTTMHRSHRLSRLATLRSVLWRFGAKPIVAGLGERLTPWAIRGYRYREKRRSTPEWVAPDPELRAAVLGRAAQSASEQRGPGSFYLREGQISLDHALVSMEMEELHEASRRTGLPIRMPYWDADVVDFLYRTPPEALNEGGRSKGLVRSMLARRFPELGFESHKKVLATNYFTGLVLREGPQAWRDLGGAKALYRTGVLDSVRLDSWIREVFEGIQLRETARLWNLMSLEVWIRGHEDRWGVS